MPETTLLCPVMIGRSEPLATLDSHLDLSREGKGHTLLIAGEAGIGKSRFVAEAKARAVALGMRTLQGNCFEPDRAFPHAPLIDLLRHLSSAYAATDITTWIGPAATDLIKIAPEIGAWFPDVAPAPTTSPEQEKRRLFHALAQTIMRAAHDRPMLLVIEDLHWCDDSSLEFLLSFARQTTAHPILILLTFRSDETHAGLGHFLATMARLRLATEIELERLNASEIDAMLRAMFALREPVQEEFVHRVYGLSDGNPFFTEEIINALMSAGDISFSNGRWDRKPVHEIRLPRTVRDAVLRRSERLSLEARELLTLAAVAGRRFDFTLLAALTGHDERQLIQLIKELMEAQLVVEASVDQFAFRHALTQQVVDNDLLTRERAALHRANAYQSEQLFAEALEGHLADLARHFYEAGEWAKALEYAKQAGARAQALYAPRAAAEQFTRALSAAQHLHLPAPEGLLRARGQAYEMLGEFTLAQADFEQALDQAIVEHDQTAEWHALVCLGMLWAGRDYQKTGEYYRRALALAEAMGDQALLARSLNRMGNWYVNHEEPVEAQRQHHAALAIMEASGDMAGIAETCDFLEMAYLLGSDLIKCNEYGQRAIALYRAGDQRAGMSSCLATLSITALAYQSNTLTPARSLSAAQGYGEEALRIARAIAYRSGEAFAAFSLGCVLGPQGKWSATLQTMHNSLAIAEEIEHRQWTCAALTGLNCVYDDLLDQDTARRYGERALEIARTIGSAHWIHCAAGHLASTCIHQHDLARAAVILDEVTATMPITSLGEHLVASARIELLLAQERFAETLAAVDTLIANTPNATTEYHAPLVALLRGKALAGNGRFDEAERCLQAGIAAAQQWDAHAVLWRLYATLANLYRRERRQDALMQALREGEAVIARLAEGITEPAMRETFAARAMAALPATPTRNARQSEKQQHGGLTAREREVARFIAQGMSNRAIAEALVVSERTVETHASNILGKLGFATRAQVAAWAVEQGLTHPRTEPTVHLG